MRYSSTQVFVFLSLFPAATAGAQHARPIDPIAAEIVVRALERSPSVQSLVRQLESSDVIVHIDTSRELPAGIGGMTRFVTKSGGHRYLRITVSHLLPWSSRIAMLAHELTHACEVAGSAVGDASSMRRWFESAGYRPHMGREMFETNAAIRVENVVRMELRERLTALEPQPVVKFDH